MTQLTGQKSTKVERASHYYATQHGFFHRTIRNKWFWRIVIIVAFLAAWQGLALDRGPFFLARVDRTYGHGAREIITNGYYLTFLHSLEQLIIGFAIACAFAIPIGAIIGRWKPARDLFAPYIHMLYVTEPTALLPFLIVMFGTDLTFRIAVVVLFSFFFPLIHTTTGVEYVSRDFMSVARAFRTSRARLMMHVIIPAATPFVLAGVRLGLAQALKGMIIAELWVVVGTGGLLTNVVRARYLDVFFALVSMVALAALIINLSLSWLERRIAPWRSSIMTGREL